MAAAPFDRETLLGEARFEREALGRTVQYANPARWDDPSPCEGWRNRDVLAHLASDEGIASALLAKEATPEFDEFVNGGGSIEDDTYNNWAVDRRRELPFREIAMEWGRAADKFMVHAAKVSEEEWRSRTVHWFGDDWTIADFVQSEMAEWWSHGEDIRAGVDLAPRIEHWPIYAVNDLSIRILPQILAGTGRSYSGKSVKLALVAAGGATWHQSLTPDVEPAETKPPDVVIDGNAHSFAMVAEQKVSADYFLDNGDIVIGGEEWIAFDILENLKPWL
ncbi:MAG: maleylpyruvate isomerase family mycothiol-dependent enzyme [Actinomycetota bacterium]